MTRHILLIDDDSDELDFFLLVQKQSTGVFTCSYLDHPVMAVTTIEKLRPDIVFLDMNMPVMTGLECLAKIKASPDVCDTPVVLYSTAMDGKLEQKAKKLGATACLKKPVMACALQKMIEKVLELLG